jgi:hypothetical protein
MKLIITLASIFLGLNAMAAEIKVLEMPYGNDFVSAAFSANESLGRAWVTVTLTRAGDEGAGEEYRKKIEGLRWDTTRKAVILTHEGQEFVCAEMKSRGIYIFKEKFLKEKECTFKQKHITEKHDDGFEVRKIRKVQVFLVTT